MTPTHPDLAALLAAVCQFPDDDTPRLVLADWLDDHEQHERAEFIRVQCELAWLRGNATRRAELVARENQLHHAHAREWSGIPCPVCEGATVAEHTADGWSSLESCAHCTGTGFAPVEFRRGFVESVRCRMGDVLRWSNSEAWTLTPWARGVLAAHPVTRWEITDREPLDNAGVGTYFGEEPGPATTWTWVRGSGPVEWEIPASVYQFCADHYDSPELARDALALAVGRVARRLAGLPEVTP